jgi:hypothetical protein
MRMATGGRAPASAAGRTHGILSPPYLRRLLCLALPVIHPTLPPGVVSGAQPGNGMTTTLDIRAYDRAHRRGKAALAAGAQPCELVWSGRDVLLSCALTMAPDVTTITLTGEFSSDSGKRMQKGTMRWRVVDMTPFLGPLRDRTRPPGDRVRDFLRQKAAFETRHASVLEAFYISNAMPDLCPRLQPPRHASASLPAEHYWSSARASPAPHGSRVAADRRCGAANRSCCGRENRRTAFPTARAQSAGR